MGLHLLTGQHGALQCPAMCLSERERRFKAFANRNALVEDPAAAFLAEDQVSLWIFLGKNLF